MEELRAQLAQAIAERDAAVAARDALAGAVREEREAQDAFDNAGWDTYAAAARAIASARGVTDAALAAAGGV